MQNKFAEQAKTLDNAKELLKKYRKAVIIRPTGFGKTWMLTELIKDYKISTGQLDRLRKNENVSTYTLNQLCGILKCDLNDIAQYTSNQDNETGSPQ